jgi:hypothetical protein
MTSMLFNALILQKQIDLQSQPRKRMRKEKKARTKYWDQMIPVWTMMEMLRRRMNQKRMPKEKKRESRRLSLKRKRKKAKKKAKREKVRNPRGNLQKMQLPSLLNLQKHQNP